ncbi:hypothetical protein [Paenibacillus jiagnxiensis]|uniref:hypothetical protein n=1 Tax=Paenibacillus jiagnxiensis TaxID=3228926 RepID=UPI0033A9CBF0
MRAIRQAALTLVAFVPLLTGMGCEAGDKKGEALQQQAAPETAAERQSQTTSVRESKPCGVAEWVDFLMINDIKYVHSPEDGPDVNEKQLGDEVGRVGYTLNENACSDHVSRNGDAAYIPAGTTIYAMKGYKPEFRVIADNKLYQASENVNAATLGDLLDIEGRMAKVSLESGRDGSAIGDFSGEASEQFVRQLLALPYVGWDAVYNKTRHESGVFLRVHLQDGTSLRLVFYPKGNGFTAGAFGTESLQELIMTERARIKAAVGM